MQSTTRVLEPFNGRQRSETVIGIYHVEEPFTDRRLYETASWYTEIEVQPGTYEIRLTNDGWVLITLTGPIVDEHFVNRLFSATSVAEKRNIGKPGTVVRQYHPYVAAEKFATDRAWEMAEDWSLRVARRKSDTRTYLAFGLLSPDGKEHR